jgi:hypothetical protein
MLITADGIVAVRHLVFVIESTPRAVEFSSAVISDGNAFKVESKLPSEYATSQPSRPP